MAEYMEINGKLRRVPAYIDARGGNVKAEWFNDPDGVEARVQREDAELEATATAKAAVEKAAPKSPAAVPAVDPTAEKARAELKALHDAIRLADLEHLQRSNVTATGPTPPTGQE